MGQLWEQLPCLLYLESGHVRMQLGMSALGQKESQRFANQDHGEVAERRGGLEGLPDLRRPRRRLACWRTER